MPLEYNELKSHDDDVLVVLEEHTEWFHRLIQLLFYFDEDKAPEAISKPTSFAQWVVEANRSEHIQTELVERLTTLHADLFKIADTLLHGVKEKREKPRHKAFQDYMVVYESFMHGMRRLERDIVAEGSGYDTITGLRSGKMLISDVNRELDRFARQGRSFCLALARIENFEHMQKNLPQAEVDGHLKLLSGLMKLSIRSFDDAYYMGGDEFVLCLKQTDVSGGIVALERLREEMEKQNITIEDEDGVFKPFRLICCVAEPFDGDDVDDVVGNLRNSLSGLEHKDSGSVLQYQELSPLQRYVQGS